MIALKTILKEIDPLAFDESLKMKKDNNKTILVKQSDDDRAKMNKKWDALNSELFKKDPTFVAPSVPF